MLAVESKAVDVGEGAVFDGVEADVRGPVLIGKERVPARPGVEHGDGLVGAGKFGAVAVVLMTVNDGVNARSLGDPVANDIAV